MPTYPFRSLSTKGILKDPAPFDLGPDAWSGGVNVFFDGNYVGRSPIFRAVPAALASTPAFCVGYRPATGYDYVFTADTGGSITKYSGGVLTAVSPSGYAPLPATGQFTACQLGSVSYINNPSGVPQYYGPNSTAFATVPAWSSTWSARSLRGYKDYLVALNVTKGGVSYPTMVKTSNNTLFGQTPSTFDQTDQTNNSTENVLSDMTSPIVDGAVLRDMFVIYGDREIWQMQATSGQEVFNYYRLFSQGGLVAPNCVVEIDGWHYCFGTHDIYRHNGVSFMSLVEEKNKASIFRSLNRSLAKRCFVFYSPEIRSVLFCYVSSDADVAYPAPTGCNKGFLINLQSGSQTYIDLPNVTSMSVANLNSILQWNTSSGVTWANIGGSWYDQTDGFADNVVGTSQALTGYVTANRLVAHDFMDKGSLAFPYLTELNPPAYLERTGLDMDEVGANVNDYKIISRVYPEITVIRPDVKITVKIGAQLTAQSPVNYGNTHTFVPQSGYKVDSRVGGRFLAYQFSMIPAGDFRMSGFDVDVVSGGSR